MLLLGLGRLEDASHWSPEPLSPWGAPGEQLDHAMWGTGSVGKVSESPLTWAEGGAGDLLERLPITEGTTVEWRRVGACPGALLPAPATAVVARRPLRPGGPATVHCKRRCTALTHQQSPVQQGQKLSLGLTRSSATP